MDNKGEFNKVGIFSAVTICKLSIFRPKKKKQKKKKQKKKQTKKKQKQQNIMTSTIRVYPH